MAQCNLTKQEYFTFEGVQRLPTTQEVGSAKDELSAVNKQAPASGMACEKKLQKKKKNYSDGLYWIYGGLSELNRSVFTLGCSCFFAGLLRVWLFNILGGGGAC